MRQNNVVLPVITPPPLYLTARKIIMMSILRYIKIRSIVIVIIGQYKNLDISQLK